MTTEQTQQEKREEKRKKDLAREIGEDFLRRQKERRNLERGWQLNMNFVSGDQYCDVSPAGELEEEDPTFYWQSRRCFNHIAPTLDTRLAHLAKVRPRLTVRAFSDSEEDLKTARLATGILQSAKNRVELDRVIARATLWSETCGTSFYKIVWNFDEGNIIGTDETGHSLKEGDVNVVAVSPFEIYPDSLAAEGLEQVKSLIHAKAVPVSEIKEKFGVELPGRELGGLVPYSSASGWKRPADGDASPALPEGEILIERYTMPDGEHPEGRLEIAAGGVLLHEGPLPYLNGDRGTRVFPFARQTCTELAGSFFGSSIVDRMIPLQRAYNAVRNRKHEFLNRLTSGVIAVEDGSVDADEIAEDGLYPGKVLVYRQGSKEPHFLDCGSLPSEFEKEEERIANEFILFSGMSEISRNSANPTHVTSASGLQLLLDQDTARMQMSVESIERAVKETGKQILHLYKQFAAAKRLLKMTGVGGETELYYFGASDISADDVEFDTDYEKSADQIKEETLALLSSGLLGEEGALTEEVRLKVLDSLGYGSFEAARGISKLHLRKAEKENIRLESEEFEADDYDDHKLHITEHTRALLSGGEENETVKAHIAKHIASHRAKL